MINIFNKSHFDITIENHTFKAFEEETLRVNQYSNFFKLIRCNKSLRVGKDNNQEYKKRYNLVDGNRINFCYDIISQHSGEAYKYAIESLSNPIIEYLNGDDVGFVNRPLKKINCRFFNSKRINQQGKCPVGPNDVFFSHGIGDKNYWTGKNIKEFNYAFVPGPAWEQRMRETGYLGEVFVTGYTKLDPIINGLYKKQETKKPYIVWAPTHGYNNKCKGRSSYPQCMSLINKIPGCYETKIAMHPTSKMHNRIPHKPTLQELVDADVVIADAGSTLYEAWILGKPVIFPDWICSKDVLTHFKNDKQNFEYQIYSKKIGYHAKSMSHLVELIDIALSNGMKDEEREFIEGIYPSEIRGKAGQLSAKQLNEIATIRGF